MPKQLLKVPKPKQTRFAQIALNLKNNRTYKSGNQNWPCILRVLYDVQLAGQSSNQRAKHSLK